MRRFVNGDDIELDSSLASVSRRGDRWVVRSAGGSSTALAVTVGDAVLVSYGGRQFRVERKSPRRSHHHHLAEGEMRSTMPGQIVDVLVAAGDAVRKGQTILVLEAMKTQQPFIAPFDGTVTQVEVEKGQQVGEGFLMAVVEES